MRWLVIICATCVLACTAIARAQMPPDAFAPSKVNAERLRWLEYRLVAGRVAASSAYPEGMNVSFGPSLIGGRLREHLQLLILKDQASVRYELDGAGQRLSIVLDQDGDFSLTRTRKEPNYQVRFVQQTGQPPTLTVVEQDRVRSVQGASFWHLYLAEPELMRRHLIPDLELLRPSWQLSATGWAIEEALVQRAQHPQKLDTQRWSGLVAELASSEFAKRQSAERQLRQIGQAILPFLEGLDRKQLDPEQAARVESLVAVLSVNYEDNADRIATWLAADEQVWLSLLTRPEEVKRRVAAQRLAALVGHPIDFDPQADAAARQTQFDRLQARYRGATKNLPPIADDKARSVPPPRAKR